MVQLAGAPGGDCTPLRRAPEDPQRWVQAALHTVRHITDTHWDPDGLNQPVAIAQFLGAEATADPDLLDDLVDIYGQFAAAFRQAYPEVDGAPGVKLAGLEFEFDDDSFESGADHAVKGFIRRIADAGHPIDVLPFSVVTQTPAGARRIARALRSALDDAGLVDTELLSSRVLPKRLPDYSDPRRIAAYRGAFDVATRLYFQDVPVTSALIGPGPPYFADGQPHPNTPLSQLAELLVPSGYFDGSGSPTPSFMALLPLRQIAEHQRVMVRVGADDDGGRDRG